jgi:hypothetical protein
VWVQNWNTFSEVKGTHDVRTFSAYFSFSGGWDYIYNISKADSSSLSTYLDSPLTKQSWPSNKNYVCHLLAWVGHSAPLCSLSKDGDKSSLQNTVDKTLRPHNILTSPCLSNATNLHNYEKYYLLEVITCSLVEVHWCSWGMWERWRQYVPPKHWGPLPDYMALHPKTQYHS